MWIAVRNKASGDFFLNGHGDFPETRSVIEKGLEWEYENKNNKDTIQMNGPLKNDVVVMVISHELLTRGFIFKQIIIMTYLGAFALYLCFRSECMGRPRRRCQSNTSLTVTDWVTVPMKTTWCQIMLCHIPGWWRGGLPVQKPVEEVFHCFTTRGHQNLFFVTFNMEIVSNAIDHLHYLSLNR